MLLAFIEPANSKDKDFFEHNAAYFIPLVTIESFILVVFFMECGMEIYHRSFDKIRNFNEHYVKNFKMMIKISTCFIFLIDFLIFYSDPIYTTFRFGRLFRPFCLALYQKQLRRTIQGILRSISEMLNMFLLFIIIMFVYTFLGMRIIGEMEGAHEYIDDFGSFRITFNNMYLLITRDNYPVIMLNAYKQSPLYLLYFIPFLVVDILLLIPIPIAVMFEAFRVEFIYQFN